MISRDSADEIAAALEQGWNAGDGHAFAAPFLDDADFVNVRGQLIQGREAIAAGHDGIFRSIYAGSQVHYSVRTLRELASGVALMHLDSVLEVPSGPLAGPHRALLSLVLEEGDSGWRIAAVHNTLVAPPPPAS